MLYINDILRSISQYNYISDATSFEQFFEGSLKIVVSRCTPHIFFLTHRQKARHENKKEYIFFILLRHCRAECRLNSKLNTQRKNCILVRLTRKACITLRYQCTNLTPL